MTGVPANRRPTNMVFQSYAIFPHLTVEQNVAYGLRRLRLGAQERDRRVNEALSQVPMSPLGAPPIHAVSPCHPPRLALPPSLLLPPPFLLLALPLFSLPPPLPHPFPFFFLLFPPPLLLPFLL